MSSKGGQKGQLKQKKKFFLKEKNFVFVQKEYLEK